MTLNRSEDLSVTPAALSPLLESLLDLARHEGATSAEASASVSRGFQLSVRQGEVESLEFQHDRDLSLTVYIGRRQGSASTSDLSPRGLAETARAACTIAAVTEEDPCAGLADAHRMARDVPDLELDHPWALSPVEAIERARACEAAALAVDRRITQSEGASLSTQRGVSAYANSHGFMGLRTGSQHSLSCAVIAESESGMQRDFWYDASRDPARLMDAEAIGREAGRRSVARLDARKLSTRQAPVLFAPEVARSLFGQFVGAISGGALYRRASFLLDARDQPVFPDWLTIRQAPFLKGAMASAAYDQEGVATADRVLVERGLLRGWLLSSYSARKLGLETTGNAGGVFNLIVEPGALDSAGLLREMGEGLLVTELIGQGVNPVTGDYSRGAAGFWVQGGAAAFPVEGITIAGNLREAYARIRAHGHDVDTRSGIRCGSVLVDGFTIAGD